MKFRTVTLALLLASPLSMSPAVPASDQVRWVAAGEREPVDLAIDLKTLEGQAASLQEFGGRVLFVNVWATWCQPCKEELPALAKAYETLHEQGFEVVAVTNDNVKKVRAFLKKTPLPFTILIDSKERVFKRFKVDRVPTALVIDKSGKLALRHTGPVDWTSPSMIDALRELISPTAHE